MKNIVYDMSSFFSNNGKSLIVYMIISMCQYVNISRMLRRNARKGERSK